MIVVAVSFAGCCRTLFFEAALSFFRTGLEDKEGDEDEDEESEFESDSESESEAEDTSKSRSDSESESESELGELLDSVDSDSESESEDDDDGDDELLFPETLLVILLTKLTNAWLFLTLPSAVRTWSFPFATTLGTSFPVLRVNRDGSTGASTSPPTSNSPASSSLSLSLPLSSSR
ncbi:hypothetical protein BGX38DRAFT_643646 [Terfezia claveryi]|nr:hypothetical protein BGX38DRAFT_643646 [Terfezia claveryi]